MAVLGGPGSFGTGPSLVHCGWRFDFVYANTDSGISNGVPVVLDRSFSEVSSLGVVPLIIPIFFASIATWAALRGRRVPLGVAALLLAVFTFISGFSIGRAYLPAAGLLIVATGWASVAGTGRQKQ